MIKWPGIIIWSLELLRWAELNEKRDRGEWMYSNEEMVGYTRNLGPEMDQYDKHNVAEGNDVNKWYNWDVNSCNEMFGSDFRNEFLDRTSAYMFCINSKKHTRKWSNKEMTQKGTVYWFVCNLMTFYQPQNLLCFREN
jgi:hypothetical protein